MWQALFSFTGMRKKTEYRRNRPKSRWREGGTPGVKCAESVQCSSWKVRVIQQMLTSLALSLNARHTQGTIPCIYYTAYTKQVLCFNK